MYFPGNGGKQDATPTPNFPTSPPARPSGSINANPLLGAANSGFSLADSLGPHPTLLAPAGLQPPLIPPGVPSGPVVNSSIPAGSSGSAGLFLLPAAPNAPGPDLVPPTAGPPILCPQPPPLSLGRSNLSRRGRYIPPPGLQSTTCQPLLSPDSGPPCDIRPGTVAPPAFGPSPQQLFIADQPFTQSSTTKIMSPTTSFGNSFRPTVMDADLPPLPPAEPEPAEVEPLVYHWFYRYNTGLRSLNHFQAFRQYAASSEDSSGEDSDEGDPSDKKSKADVKASARSARESKSRGKWMPFSMKDSDALEAAFLASAPEGGGGGGSEEKPIQTDGGRYDVYLGQRLKKAVFWDEEPAQVRRSSWFYHVNPAAAAATAIDVTRSSSHESLAGVHDDLDGGLWVPYDEETAANLENEFQAATTSNKWDCKVPVFAKKSGGLTDDREHVVMRSKEVMMHFSTPLPASTATSLLISQSSGSGSASGALVGSEGSGRLDVLDEWGQVQPPQLERLKPKVVKRGLEGLLQSTAIEDGEVDRVDHLVFVVHGIGEACDIQMRSIVGVTDSLRNQMAEMSEKHFSRAHLAGQGMRVEFLPVIWHSRGLGGQDRHRDTYRRLKQLTLPNLQLLRGFANANVMDILFYTSPFYCQSIIDTVVNDVNRMYRQFLARHPGDLFSGKVSLFCHSLGTVITYDILTNQNASQSSGSSMELLNVKVPRLDFEPVAFYAMGSPIGAFLSARGVDHLGPNFKFPTCDRFFNVFHPLDPVAYRLEPLFDPKMERVKPYTMPHHKGRKRLHLEIRDTVNRIIKSDLGQKIVDKVSAAFGAVYNMATGGGGGGGSLSQDDAMAAATAEAVAEVEAEIEGPYGKKRPKAAGDDDEPVTCNSRMNLGRRVDFVLQRAPIETLNEYVFALQSHLVYWHSEDVCLLVLKDIYDQLGIHSDADIAKIDGEVPAKSEGTVNSVLGFLPTSSSSLSLSSQVDPGPLRSPICLCHLSKT